MSDENRGALIEKAIDKGVTARLAIIGRGGGSFTVAPQNMTELLEFSKLMSLSGPCIRAAFRNQPGACLALTMQAGKWGADPFAVANKAYITRNKAGEETIAYEAQLVHSIVNTSPVLERRLRPVYEGQGTARSCRIVGYLRGEAEPFEYQSPPISQIGVKNSPLWVSDPDQQLWYYSTRAWARRHVPEILLGIYTPEEWESGEIIDHEPGPRQRVELDEPGAALQVTQALPPEFPVVDLDGVETVFHSPATAIDGLMIVLRAAHAQGLNRLEGAWESNEAAIEALGQDAGPVMRQFMEWRDEAKRREEEAATIAAAKSAAETLPGRGASEPQASPQTSASSAGANGPANLEPGHSAPAAAAGLTSIDGGLSPATVTHPPSPPGEDEEEDRRSYEIAVPARGGRPDWRTWSVALFQPKVRQAADTNSLAFLLGDNDENLKGARAALSENDRRELDETIAEQWRKIG